MKLTRTLFSVALIAGIALSTASASTLHGYCVLPAAPCSDNGAITPTNDNPPSFGFSFAGSDKTNKKQKRGGSGDFWVIGLVPDNQNTGFSLTPDGTHTTQSSVSGSLADSTEWNSGKLSSYLTNPLFAKPSHPLDAYLPSTQFADPGAAGYYVYLFDFGYFDFAQKQKGQNAGPEFSVDGGGAFPQGMIFLAVLTNPNKNGGNTVVVDTPNSASIIEAGNTPFPSAPEPGTLLMLGSAVLGLGGILRRNLNAYRALCRRSLLVEIVARRLRRAATTLPVHRTCGATRVSWAHFDSRLPGTTHR